MECGRMPKRSPGTGNVQRSNYSTPAIQSQFMSLSQIKGRVADNLYFKTMSLLYGITSCSSDYPDEEFEDDLVRIELAESRRDCHHLKLPPVSRLKHPIILNFGTCVPLPINICND